MKDNPVKLKFDEVKANYDAMLMEATPYKKYIPAMHFFGYKNQYHRWLFGDVPWFGDKLTGRYRLPVP